MALREPARNRLLPLPRRRLNRRPGRDDPRFLARVPSERHEGGHGVSLLYGDTDVRFSNLYQDIPATCYGPLGAKLHAPDELVDLESVKNVSDQDIEPVCLEAQRFYRGTAAIIVNGFPSLTGPALPSIDTSSSPLAETAMRKLMYAHVNDAFTSNIRRHSLESFSRS